MSIGKHIPGCSFRHRKEWRLSLRHIFEQDTSDSQLDKQAGNGVTVNVIEAIGTLLRQVDEEIRAEDEKTKR